MRYVTSLYRTASKIPGNICIDGRFIYLRLSKAITSVVADSRLFVPVDALQSDTGALE